MGSGLTASLLGLSSLSGVGGRSFGVGPNPPRPGLPSFLLDVLASVFLSSNIDINELVGAMLLVSGRSKLAVDEATLLAPMLPLLSLYNTGLFCPALYPGDVPV